jgi:hypothetical protein
MHESLRPNKDNCQCSPSQKIIIKIIVIIITVVRRRKKALTGNLLLLLGLQYLNKVYTSLCLHMDAASCKACSAEAFLSAAA